MTRVPDRVTASAPSRIDLAGGTLDIWPICLLVPGAMTVNAAVDLPATVTVVARDDDRVRIVSRDRKIRVTRRLPLASPSAEDRLALLLRIAGSFELARGMTMTVHANAPAGAGLGGSSTLAVAAGAALSRFTGAGLDRERLLRRVMNVETVELRVPAGNQDYLAAIRGGLAAYHHTVDGTRREAIRVPAELPARWVLAYTGQPRRSGMSNWDMFRRFVDGDRVAVRRMEAIGRIARELRDALVAADVDAVGRLVGEEGRLRYRLAPSVATPKLLRVGEAARNSGALGVKVCGAGRGGCLLAIARRGRTDDVARAMTAAGATVLESRIAGRGVRLG